jgi:hypothetical protein
VSIWSIAKAKNRKEVFGRSLAFVASVPVAIFGLTYVAANLLANGPWKGAIWVLGAIPSSIFLMRYALYRKWP